MASSCPTPKSGPSRSRYRRPSARATVGVSIGVLALGLGLTACGSSSSGSGSGGGKVGVSLILKTLSNPYFVAMEKDAKSEAAKDGVKLTVAAGTQDGDTQSQISAINNAISRGDKGILITTNGDAVNSALTQAKQQGLYVIALDTATNPASVANITFATDNTAAGKEDGQYAAAKLGNKPAVIAMLDLFDNQVVSVDIDRDHGFLQGMGIDPGSTTQNGQEAKTGTYTGGGSYTIVCHKATQGAENGGRTAMEDCLSANSNINTVYAINEPAAQGAYDALKAANKLNGVSIYAIDGSCLGVNLVKTGEFTADAGQFPGKMALLGVDAIAQKAKTGKAPTTTAGKSFFDTGTDLIAGTAVSGVTSVTPDAAASTCWGTASGS